MVPPPSPPAPYHLSAGGRWIRTFGSPTDPLPFRDSQAHLPSRFDLPTRNRRFESAFLQRGVRCEPVLSCRRESETTTLQIDPTGLTTSPQLYQPSHATKAPA